MMISAAMRSKGSCQLQHAVAADGGGRELGELRPHDGGVTIARRRISVAAGCVVCFQQYIQQMHHAGMHLAVARGGPFIRWFVVEHRVHNTLCYTIAHAHARSGEGAASCFRHEDVSPPSPMPTDSNEDRSGSRDLPLPTSSFSSS
jgi:hypothetical protein